MTHDDTGNTNLERNTIPFADLFSTGSKTSLTISNAITAIASEATITTTIKTAIATIPAETAMAAEYAKTSYAAMTTIPATFRGNKITRCVLCCDIF